MVENLFENSLRRNQNKEFSFPFFVGSSPDPSTEKLIVRKNSLVLVPSGARQRGAQISNAYTEVSHHHALRALQVVQSLCDCSKWVRARCNNSSQHIFLEKTPLGVFSFEYSCDLTSNLLGAGCVGIEADARYLFERSEEKYPHWVLKL